MTNASATKTRKVFDGRYEIGSVVGRGAKSVVYEARLLSNPQEQVALKVLIAGSSQNATTERLRREALALVSCRHKYVVRLDDFHSAGPLSYLALEFAPLGDLRRYSSQVSLSVETIERFLKQSLEALAYIHRAGIVHRDIKPENILVASDKEIRVTDFGVALLPGEEASLADLQSGIGTMNYMAPEIIEGKQLDARADLYALGVIFYELLAGKNPFEDAPLAQQLELRKQQSFAELHTISKLEVPEYLDEIILRSMSYEPTDRYATADEMLQALIDGHSAAFEKSVAESKSDKKQPIRISKIKRPKTVPLSKRYKYKEAEREAERLFKELFGEDADWLKDTPTDKKEDEIPGLSTAPALDGVAALNQIGKESAVDAFSPHALDQELPAEITADVETTVAEHLAGKELSEPVALDNGHDASETIVTPIAKTAANTVIAKPTQDIKPKEIESDDDEAELEDDTIEVRRSFSQFIIPALAVLFIIFAAPTVVRRTYSIVSSISSLHLFSSDAKLLPETTEALAATSQFPILPGGVYHGNITGLLGNGAIPITLISYPESQQLGLIVQLEGFRPIWISTEGLQANSSVFFSSSGLVLEMTGQLVDGQIIGFYKNLISGRQGKWSIQ